jgi:hypothetical protein
MWKASTIYVLILITLVVCSCATEPRQRDPVVATETKAVEFLKREVPAWSRDNGCFSCHNNGDAARALYAASRKGYRISPSMLAETTEWIAHPDRWEHNKGDPGFSDQRLADVQFAASLAAATEAGAVSDWLAVQAAASKVAQAQADDGSWPIDIANPAGSPATYGATLATYMAWDVLKRASLPQTTAALNKAEAKLRKTKPDSVPNAAVLLLFRADTRNTSTNQEIKISLDFLRRAQTRDGGWGPYADAPPEAFDTALALLALAEFRTTTDVPRMIQRGREFLRVIQLPDGSWPATTRPSGGQSYAQQMSTTGWATLALLATR